MNRRKFLKNTSQMATGALTARVLAGFGSAAATVSGLSGCSSIDSLFTTGKREYEKEVFIIGGGAAGLMAAHTLKKNRIPFRLFEASSRPGGRTYTVEVPDGTALEMGAESFEGHHKLVFELLKEFQLEWDESVWDPAHQALWRSTRGDVLVDSEYQKISSNLIQKMIQNRVQAFGTSDQYQILSPALANELDALSMAQYLKVNWVQPDERVTQYWEAWARTQYSAEADRVSALRWIWDQQPERKTRSLYRIKGGWENLNKMLFDRVAGVIPDHLVKLRWALTGIRKTESGYRCVFKTPKGTEILETQHLILAIPVNQYARINGFFDLDLTETKKHALKTIKLGEAAKTYVSFKSGTTDIWEKSFLRNQVQMSYLKSESADWVGGLRGGTNSQWTLPDIENWRSNLLTNGANLKEGQFDYQVLNWKDRPYIQGGRSLWEPGQWGSYSTIFEQGDFKESLQWAGEFVPALEKGSVNAALLSGQTAALKIIERMRAMGIATPTV